jgi:hypothetical protein
MPWSTTSPVSRGLPVPDRSGSGSSRPAQWALRVTGSAQAIPFTGTVEDPGPTWRVTGYDADGDEFHGHARQVGPTGPGATGTTDLIFEVPAGTPLRRVLLSDGMVDVG